MIVSTPEDSTINQINQTLNHMEHNSSQNERETSDSDVWNSYDGFLLFAVEDNFQNWRGCASVHPFIFS